jgi:hypothetical protein
MPIIRVLSRALHFYVFAASALFAAIILNSYSILKTNFFGTWKTDRNYLDPPMIVSYISMIMEIRPQWPGQKIGPGSDIGH